MDRSTVRATLAVLAPLGISLQFVFADVPPRADRLPTSQTAPSALAASGLVLSEVLFDPLAGARPFAELLNAGTGPVNVSRVVRDWLGHTSVAQTSTYLATTTKAQHDFMRRFDERRDALQDITTKDGIGGRTGGAVSTTTNGSAQESSPVH